MPWSFLFPIAVVLEIFLLIKVGGAIGVLFTLLWLLASGVVGVLLIRQAGVNLLVSLARSSDPANPATGSPPAAAVVQVVAGLLLLLPGVGSDLLGALLLLLPAGVVRSLGRILLARWAVVNRFAAAKSGNPPGTAPGSEPGSAPGGTPEGAPRNRHPRSVDDTVIEGEFRRDHPE